MAVEGSIESGITQARKAKEDFDKAKVQIEQAKALQSIAEKFTLE